MSKILLILSSVLQGLECQSLTTRASSSVSATSTISSSVPVFSITSNPNIVGSAPPPTFDFSGFPPPFNVVAESPEFSSKYDFSKVSNYPIASPPESGGPPACNALNANTCSWSCTYPKCTQKDDVITCPLNSDWALTYDDGPSTHSQQIVDRLNALNVKSTFAVTGSNVIQFPEVLWQEFQKGHQIVIHTWSHRALTTLATDVIIAELEWTALAIERVIGVRPKYMRPPYGDIDDRVRDIVRAMGLKPIMWNYDSRDFEIALNANAIPAGVISANASSAALGWQSRKEGMISLQHDVYANTVNVAIGMMDAIAGSGMKIKSVAECIGDLNPYQKGNAIRNVEYTSIIVPHTGAKPSPTAKPIATQSSSKSNRQLGSIIQMILLGSLIL